MKKTVHVIPMLIVSLAFICSGVLKILDPEGFALAVYRYHLLPGGLVNIVALWLPVIEVLCAILLFVPGFRSPATGILLVLLILFSGVIAVSILSGNTMACGCFTTSVHADAMSWSGLVKNLILVLLILWGIKSGPLDRTVRK